MLLPSYGKLIKTPSATEIIQNSLPSKDHFSLICGALLRCLSSMQKNEQYIRLTHEILRTLDVIVETDYGLNSLRV